MNLRYVIARLVPDLIRDEPINVGIILQSDEWVASKFIERVPKAWGLEPDLVEDVAERLDSAWKSRLATHSELVYLENTHEQRQVSLTDEAFLQVLHGSYQRHLRFSEIRQAQVSVKTRFDFDTFLNNLYTTFVAPRPRLRKPARRSRLRTKIRHEIRQLQLPVREKIRDGDMIEGSFPWQVDFSYRLNGNGSGHVTEVGIALVDFALKRYLDRAKEVLGIWADLKSTRPDDVKRISVIGSYSGLEDHESAMRMLDRYSETYLFELQKDRFLDRVAGDLQPLDSLGQENGK